MSTSRSADKAKIRCLELIAALRKERKLATVSGTFVQRRFRIARSQCGSAFPVAERLSLAALSSTAGCRPLSAADFPRNAHRCPPGQYRLPVSLQVLRRSPDLRWPAEDGDAGTDGVNSESPEEYLGANAVQFYDNNFFLNESHARRTGKRLVPLGMRWWAEGRIDTVLRYSDETWRPSAAPEPP